MTALRYAAPRDRAAYSLRHHRRRRREEDSSSSSSSSGSEDEQPTPAPAPRDHTHLILLILLLILVIGAASFAIWLLNRGYSNSSMASSASLPSFQSDCLSAHNDFRATHHAPDLTWNETLADSSRRWAQECQWKHSEGKMLPGGGYGENLFATASNAFKANDTSIMDTKAGVDAWNSEESMYDYDKPTGFSEATGHFTQTVWKSTSSVGCWFQACKGIFGGSDIGVYLVCQYYPAGNVVTDDLQYFKDNVQAPS